jgi:hypothetical protein
MNLFKSIVFCATMFIATPSMAADILKSVPEKLDPAKAYLLIRMGERSPNLWNILTLAAYDENNQDIRGKGRAKTNPVIKPADRFVTIGPKPFIAEQDHVRTYLVAVTPGRYVIAGGPTTCFCLGSYQFDAGANVITDMGVIYIGPENGSSPWAALSQLRSSPDIEARAYTVADAIAVYTQVPIINMPTTFETLPRTPVIYNAAPRLGNHSGQLLNRALPLDPSK